MGKTTIAVELLVQIDSATLKVTTDYRQINMNGHGNKDCFRFVFLEISGAMSYLICKLLLAITSYPHALYPCSLTLSELSSMIMGQITPTLS